MHSRLLRELDAELCAQHRLPLSSYEVLLNLSGAPERRMRMSELADSVLLSRSGLSRLCDRLERDGMVERVVASTDARGAFAVITPLGLARFWQAQLTHLAGVRERFTSRFSDSELRELAALWERVLPGASS